MAKLSIGSPLQLAEKLFKIRAEIEAFLEPVEKLKAKEEKLRTEMLEALKANRMDSLKTERGINYSRVSRATLVVSDPVKGLAWALEHNCAKVDTTQASKFLKGRGALPEGFEEKFTESLRIEGIKDALEV